MNRDHSQQNNLKIVEEQVQESLKMNARGMINFYNALIGREDYTPVLYDAAFPVHWVIGGRDNVLSYRKIFEKCYRSPVNFVSFYKNCGHMSMFEEPNQLTIDLKEFLNFCYAR